MHSITPLATTTPKSSTITKPSGAAYSHSQIRRTPTLSQPKHSIQPSNNHLSLPPNSYTSKIQNLLFSLSRVRCENTRHRKLLSWCLKVSPTPSHKSTLVPAHSRTHCANKLYGIILRLQLIQLTSTTSQDFSHKGSNPQKQTLMNSSTNYIKNRSLLSSLYKEILHISKGSL